jgi:signal transduction histidine kinase
MIYILLLMVAAVALALGLVSLYQNQARQPVLFALVLVAFAASMSFFLLYLCKDSFHLGLFLNYFPFPRNVVLRLYTLQVPKTTLLRLLNLGCASFLMANALFSASFLRRRAFGRVLLPALGAYLLFQVVAYDPAFYRWLYRLIYPAYWGSEAIERFYSGLGSATSLVDGVLLALCVPVVAAGAARGPRAREAHLTGALLVVCYALLITSYLMFFHRLPSLLIKYSEAADTITYRSLAAGSGMAYYRYFPYAVSALLLLLGASFTVYWLRIYRAGLMNQDVIRNIRAANVSSRLFCHYMKNEILAISAEVEALDVAPESREATQSILNRCDAIYDKLDGIHKSMRDNTMRLTRTRVDEVALAAVENVRGMNRLEGIELTVQCPASPVYAMLDRVHFELAIAELLLNASDAMEGRPEKRLTVRVVHGVRWASVAITDNGCGIEPGNLVNIFTPLYTTKRISMNWGIGLTMAHKTIAGLGGRINVRSTVGEGSTFEVLVPVSHAFAPLRAPKSALTKGDVP